MIKVLVFDTDTHRGGEFNVLKYIYAALEIFDSLLDLCAICILKQRV